MFKLMIDCGHGLTTAGKQTLNGSKGIIKEFTLNKAVYLQLVELLKDYDVEVKTCFDLTGKTDTLLIDRVRTSNLYKPDLFISIHHNAFNSQWGNHTGVELHISTNSSKTSLEVAECLLPLLSKSTGLKQRNVNKIDWYVVKHTTSPSILVEGGFMDSNIDYPVITSIEGQKAYAKAIFDMLIKYFNIKKKSTSSNTVSSSNTFYRVIADSFTIKANAEKRQSELKKIGYDSFLTTVTKDNKIFYRVVIGSFSNKQNAIDRQTSLKKYNINTFLEAYKK